VNTIRSHSEGLGRACEVGAILPADGGDSGEVLREFVKTGTDVDALAAQLQEEGAKVFIKSWKNLMTVVTDKSAALPTAGAH
jgi:transaldolase